MSTPAPDQTSVLQHGDLTLYQHYVRENISTVNASCSNENLLSIAMVVGDSQRVLCQLRANTPIDHLTYKHDLSANTPDFICEVCMGLLSSGYPVVRMCRMIDAAIVKCDQVKDAINFRILTELRDRLRSPLSLKAQSRIYMKRYFSARGPICAHASKIQRGHKRGWKINFFQVLDHLPLPEPVKNYLLLSDLVPNYTSVSQ